MERLIYTSRFTLDTQLDWHCPTCGIGLLRIVKKSFSYNETLESKKSKGDPDWYPDWGRMIFNCLLKCLNDKCGDLVSCVGTGEVEIVDVDYENGYPEEIAENFFTPTFFEPSLKLFNIPINTPFQIAEKLDCSFKLFFSSPDSAGNQIRAALEELLTQLNIKRYEAVKKKRRRLSLHQRIDLLPAKYSKIKDLVFAVKWLGNVGSHGGEKLSKDDVLNAYEVMEFVLEEIYERKSSRINALAKKINKCKGPIK